MKVELRGITKRFPGVVACKGVGRPHGGGGGHPQRGGERGGEAAHRYNHFGH